MKLVKRLAFYLGGFAIGIILLIFFVSGSDVSCDYAYGPTARVLKNIRSKELKIDPKAASFLQNYQIDSVQVRELLLKGDVVFSESNTTLDSCKQYVIEEKLDELMLKIRVVNCDKQATIIEASTK